MGVWPTMRQHCNHFAEQIRVRFASVELQQTGYAAHSSSLSFWVHLQFKSNGKILKILCFAHYPFVYCNSPFSTGGRSVTRKESCARSSHHSENQEHHPKRSGLLFVSRGRFSASPVVPSR